MSELFPAKTIGIEVLTCTDPSREAEFNRWYDKVHIPVLRATPGIQSVHRYRDLQPENRLEFGDLLSTWAWPKEHGGNRYLTLYRIYSDDPWGLMQKVKKNDKKRAEQGKMIDCMKTWEVIVWGFYAYRKTVLPPERQQRPSTNLPDGMPEALLLVPTRTVNDPTSREAQDDWWLYTHSHDLCEYPGLVQAQRYHNLNPKPAEDEALSVNIYELDHDDLVALLAQICKDDRGIRRPQGRFLPGPPGSSRVVSYARGLYQHWDIMSANFT